MGAFFGMLQVREELFSLGDITWPLVLTGLLIFAISPLSMFFLGRLGDVEFAGGSLAMGFANITGYSAMKGLSMGMEPVCVKAFGARKWNLISQAFQKILLILLLACTPIAIFWLNMKTILLKLGQEQHITSVASVYTGFCLPDLLAHAFLHSLRIILRSQGHTRLLTMSATISFLFHVPINYLLVVYLKLGMKGVALSSAWTTINTNFAMALYLYLSDAPIKPLAKTKIEQQNQVMLQNRAFFTMSITSAVFVCLEWWWYEVMLILCGRLSNPKGSVAAMGILIQTTGLIYVVPSSLGSGVSARVGHEQGTGRPARAQWAAAVGLEVDTAYGLAALVFTTVAKNLWGTSITCFHGTPIVCPPIGNST